jgi:hypothetical protein
MHKIYITQGAGAGLPSLSVILILKCPLCLEILLRDLQCEKKVPKNSDGIEEHWKALLSLYTYRQEQNPI